MDNPLTANCILSFPFCPESFCLLGLANRAISLFSVVTIKRMAVFAMRFSGVLRRYRTAFSQSVFVRGSKPKVAYRNASTIPAGMVHHHSGRDISIVMPESNPMRAPAFSSEKKDAIAILVKKPLVNQTFSLRDCFPKESFFLFFDHRHDLYP